METLYLASDDETVVVYVGVVSDAEDEDGTRSRMTTMGLHSLPQADRQRGLNLA